MDDTSQSLFTKVFQIILIILLTATVGLVLVQVFARYVAQQNVRGVEELARLTLVWGCFLGSGYAALHNDHIVVDIIHDRVSPRMSRILRFCSHLVMFLVSLVMIFAGTAYALRHWVYPDLSITLLFPRSLYYFPLPVCGVIVLLKSGHDMYAMIRKADKGGLS